jgi:hypothetical protein
MPRPATGKTPVRNVRVSDGLWKSAQEKAQSEGRTMTEVIATYLRRYISTPPRKGSGTREAERSRGPS